MCYTIIVEYIRTKKFNNERSFVIMLNYKVSAKVRKAREGESEKFILINLEQSPVLMEREIASILKRIHPNYKLDNITYCCYPTKHSRGRKGHYKSRKN